MGKYTGPSPFPDTRRRFAQFAFSLYESRRWQDGHHIEDWLRAKQELVRHYGYLRLEKVDLPSWCFTLSDSEYQACSPAHVSGSA